MKIERNLGMDLMRATEMAALRSGRMMGRGDKNAADQAAVDAMRYALENAPMDGIVVIGVFVRVCAVFCAFFVVFVAEFDARYTKMVLS